MAAWYGVLFTRQRRLPSLSVLFNPTRKIEGETKKQYDAQHDSLVREMG